MPPAPDIHDSTDWLPTPLAPLTSLDAALRCQICKDFFDTPVITSCSHTFCSICIRRCLSTEGKCPACRSNDQELKLRRNWAVEELVAAFSSGREELLRLGRQAAEQRAELEEPSRKRRRLRTDPEHRQEPASGNGRTTRSQSRRSANASNDDEEYIVEDSEADSVGSLRRTPTAEPDDGLVACPGCSKRMKADEVFVHLDRCTSASSSSDTTRNKSQNGVFESMSIAYGTTPAQQNRERLPTVSYSLLKESLLRKKMRELGISDAGSRPLLQKRHTEWVNLWNANCDSRHPKDKRELLRELETWERTQGGRLADPSSSREGQTVMSKDFDGASWSKGHDNDFKRLIEEARRKRKANGVQVSPAQIDEALKKDFGQGNSKYDTESDRTNPTPSDIADLQKPLLINMSRETDLASSQTANTEDVAA